MPRSKPAELVPVKLVRQRPKTKRGAAKLWVKEPESQADDPSLLAARLCSCSDVCLAVIEDR
jgi:hypothetical protein